MTKPFSPQDVEKNKITAFPEEVIDEFNKMITKNYSGGSSTVVMKEIANAIASRMDIDVGEVYRNHWLDVEDVYRKAGWKVEYDKPVYNETYHAFFKFTKKNSGIR